MSEKFGLDFEKLRSIALEGSEVMPVAVQDVDSKEVLMIAYVNRQALEETLTRQVAVFWSTSRQKLWIKGETSGDTLHLVDIRTNCYGNSLLYIVRLAGEGMCHTKDEHDVSRFGCYYRHLKNMDQVTMVQHFPYSGS
jgi:phosphoribosyl-AMP cyclohydrolase